MAKTNNLTDFLTGLADKLRAKLGGTALINPQCFESKIDEVYQKGYDAAPQGTDVSDTTATPFDVLAGKYFYLANGTKEDGRISAKDSWSNPALSVTDVPGSKLLKANSIPEGGSVMLNAGAVYTLNVPYSAVADAIGLTGDKIVSGNTVLGVAGTAQMGGNTFDMGSITVSASAKTFTVDTLAYEPDGFAVFCLSRNTSTAGSSYVGYAALVNGAFEVQNWRNADVTWLDYQLNANGFTLNSDTTSCFGKSNIYQWLAWG